MIVNIMKSYFTGNRIIILFVGLFYISVNISVLYFGNVNEDAYILFQYSKKLYNGSGIVFDRFNGPTEGATDFLWMILLAIFHKMKIDSGTAAAILNGLGLSLIVYVIFSLSRNITIKSILIIFLFAISGGTAAALGGFSTLAYGGLYSLFTLSLIKKKYYVVTVLSTILPLFRPDAVLLVSGGLIALYVISGYQDRRKYLITIIIPTISIWIIYFFWRMHYFGNILPLPLLVKSHTDSIFEGANDNFRALRFYIPLLIPLFILFLKNKIGCQFYKNILLILLGPLILFTGLLFAHQSQNVGYRFQFPIIISLGLIFLISDISKVVKNYKLSYLLPIFGLVLGAKIITSDIIRLTNSDYINSFPQLLRINDYKVDNIAITEAGRFPFWYDADRMTDLVGLNTAEVVNNGAAKTLIKAHPPLIYINQAGRFNTSIFNKKSKYFITPSTDILLSSTYLGRDSTKIAPEVALNFAIQNQYIAVFVKNGEDDSEYSNVYFLAKNLDLAKFIDVLEKSQSTKMTYYESVSLLQSSYSK